MVMLHAFTLLCSAAHPPNILHIMADDTGWNDLGYKNTLINSPNIDHLALDGIRLVRHHAFKVCSPSRASFHTGRMAFSMGLYDNSNRAVAGMYPVVAQATPLHFKLLPELLKSQGYATHAIGKWHLGFALKKYTPTERGYDTFFGYYSAMTEDYWEHTHSVANGCELGLHSRDLHDSTSRSGPRAATDNGTYEATLFGDRAVDIITRHDPAAGPMFMYLAFHNEHDPHQAPSTELSIDKVGHIKTDTYKVTAALIQTMDVQVCLSAYRLNPTVVAAQKQQQQQQQ